MSYAKFFDPAKAYARIRDEILPEIDRVLTAGDLILRKDVEDFEKNLAEFVGTKYAVAVASGTDALILSLKAAGIRHGSRVLVPSYTFRATAEAVHHVGAIPYTYDMDGVFEIPQEVKAVIVAHIAGEICANMGRIVEQCKERRIPLIEDAAQAIGAAPIQGLAATYSFYPAKILGCYGDGGAVCTNDSFVAARIHDLRNHCKDDWRGWGYNSRLDNLQAAVLNVKLKRLPADIARRKEIAEMYDAALKDVVELPTKRELYQDYIIATDRRDELYDYLAERGVETMKNGYPFPAALTKGPKTQEYEARSLRLPCNPELTDPEVEHVITTIRAFYA